MKATFAALILLVLIVADVRADRILIPVLYNGPGSNGSTWFSFAEAVNRSSASWRSPHTSFIVPCVIPEGCVSDQLEPGQHGFLTEGDGPVNAPGGVLLYTPAAVDDVAIYARLGAATIGSTASSLATATEIPRVPELQFKSGSIFLPSVPLIDPLVRTTLRVYALDVSTTSVNVLIRDWFTPTAPPLSSRVLQLSVPAINDPADPSPLFPAFAQASLQQLFADVQGRGTVSVEVRAPAGVKFWAFASVTDNTTNRVTTITP